MSNMKIVENLDAESFTQKIADDIKALNYK